MFGSSLSEILKAILLEGNMVTLADGLGNEWGGINGAISDRKSSREKCPANSSCQG
jgi:hypothetical protein